MKPHRYCYIWMSSSRGVTGFDLDYLNGIIDDFNHQRLYRYSTFAEYLSYIEGEEYSGFCPLWNRGNPLMNKLHRIKGGEEYEQSTILPGTH